jgi:CheY-like chemotaxis protein
MLGRLIGEDVELETVLAPDLRSVFADPGQVEQVLVNLTVNAREAMPMGGKLTIEARNVTLDGTCAAAYEDFDPGVYVMIAVSDTGTGMDKDTQARIFEPFFTTKGYGTGLGLATVYGIVKQSKGRITVYSEAGLGTTFKIYLPAREETAGPISMGEFPSPTVRAVGTVLLVEDEPGVRAVARRVLQENGYIVLEAPGGADALRLVEAHEGHVDILVTDVVMPGMSGRKLAEKLTTQRPDLRVLYMSGYTDDAIAHAGILEPGTFLLEKPFTPDALLRKIHHVLSEPQASAGDFR